MLTLIVRCFLGLLVVGMSAGLFENSWGMGSRVPIEGTPAAEFQLTDLQGQAHHLSQYRGKVVLLNFWATWCKPCTKEMPAMQEAHDRLKAKGLVVLAVNELEEIDQVRAHIVEYGHTFPVLLDPDNDVANLYGVYGLPVTVFIDQQGIVQEYLKGGLLTEERINRIFENMTAQGQKAALVK
ncbi:MAG: TlpA disulfide reductase family protein [Nitrospirae bacterium]|nr:TlpA disulfide reductase family protein [Nitrospirota bacterium]MDA1304189.1 TlpA disulfide reductase family protein [Nitrospirota bacterium]